MTTRSILYEYSRAVLEELSKYAAATILVIAGVLCYTSLFSVAGPGHSLSLQPDTGPCEVSAVMTTGPPHGPESFGLAGVSLSIDSLDGDAVYSSTQRYRL